MGAPSVAIARGPCRSAAWVISAVSVDAVGVEQPDPLRTGQGAPRRQPGRVDGLAADDDQPHGLGKPLTALGQMQHELVPHRGRQVEHGDPSASDRTEEAGQAPGVRVAVEDHRAARGQRRQQLLEGRVPAEGGVLQNPVLGPDPEQVDEGGDDRVERPVRNGDRLGPARGAGGEEHVRRVVERLPVQRGHHRVGVIGREGRVDRAVGAARGPAPEQRDHGGGIVDGRDGDQSGPVPQ